MNRAPTISVIIPAYNHGRYILETLDSVFAQTFKDFEIIVVNDGSPDNTAVLLHPLAEAGRIRYFEQPNGGQASARNRGLREARGQFIAYLDDDDIWPPDKLEWQAEALRADDELPVVYGRAVFLGEEAAESPGPETAAAGTIRDDFCVANHIRSLGQSLIRAEALRAVDGFDVAIRGADDWDLWLRMSEKGRFQYSGRVALYYRLHEDNASRNYWSMYRNSMRVIRKHFGYRWNYKHRGRQRLATAFVKNFVVDAYLDEVNRLSDDGRRMQALKCVLMALYVDPAQVLRRGWRKLWLRPSQSPKVSA